MNPSVHTPCVDNLRDAKVCGLFTEASNWDGEIIKDLFLDDDVKRILTTPISLSKDMWRWKGDIRGVYMVRHGYQMLTTSHY